MRRISQALFASPSRISVVAFATLIMIGMVLLMLPQATVRGSLGAVDALFTSASAACVTGLVVLDTGKAFTSFGQVVILVLIQVGGLGIMTLSTLMILMAGRRPRFVDRALVQDTFTQSGERSFSSILRDVMIFTATIEAIGVLFLFFRFIPYRGVGESLYLAVFHAISAFCNAGFSLFSDSFTAYREDWVLNAVVCFLIVSGGIGFLVLSELRRRLPFRKRAWSRLSLHTKVVLSTTAVLLITGTLLIAGMEWNNTLASLPASSRLMACLFQSVTARTAGFNTLPIGEMANETLFVLIMLMFIGASPGSCGGGIKTSTLASLVALGLSRFQGRERAQIFNRSITQESVGKAISVVMVSMVVIVLATMILLMTEIGEISHTVSRGMFLDLLFEVVSAFGTVGLSTGVTGGLTVAGKIVLTLVMFIGRLGPLVIAVAVSKRSSARYYYAEESVMIG